jgi:hypothetical protein
MAILLAKMAILLAAMAILPSNGQYRLYEKGLAFFPLD